jgi:hypothetical protein
MDFHQLTEEKLASLCHRLAEGLHRAEASALCGIPPRDLDSWIQFAEGEEAGPRETAFLMRVMKAEAGAVHEAVTTMRAQSRGWQRLAWWLSRRHPELWGDRAAPALGVRQPQVIDMTDESGGTELKALPPPTPVALEEKETA